mmetsp:Transcript_33824/g.24861  ORF Transcript_33824/g.24861 Transcript_33824/m.24861 type:complete len:102 (-) Transcript_33824:104-409(-)
MTQTTIGYVDLIGCFHLPTKKFHVDPFLEENLSFFKKYSYPEKLREVHDSYIFALELLREVSEVEFEKMRIEGVCVGVAATVLNWPALEHPDHFKPYIDSL